TSAGPTIFTGWPRADPIDRPDLEAGSIALPSARIYPKGRVCYRLIMFVLSRKPRKPSSTASLAIARRGVSGPSARSPWSNELSRTFGPAAANVAFHDDQRARSSCHELGVPGYAIGDDVAIATPSLDVAAHETYHALHGADEAEAQRAAGLASSG